MRGGVDERGEEDWMRGGVDERGEEGRGGERWKAQRQVRTQHCVSADENSKQVT